MSQNNIKTILSVDDKDVKSKLEGLKKYYSDTFKSWASSTAETKHATMELSLAQTRLTKARYEVAAATAESGRVSKEELKTLNAEVTASRSAVAAAKQRVSASKEATAAMWMEMEASKKAQSALNDGTRARNESNKSLEQNWNQLIRVARWAGTLIGVYYGLSTAWNATLGKGIELGRQIEDMGMGISALTAANTSNISSTGDVLNSYQKFRIATSMTTETMKQLRKAAIDTPASFSEMASIFQQAYVSTSKMGKGFGLTVEDITKNTVQLSTRMANIAGAIGMPMQKALEETRSLLSGQASGDSLIASLLFGSPAQANEAMRKAQEAGPLGVKKMLDGVMESFDVLAGVDTYSKSLAQATGAYENLVTRMASPIKNYMAEAFNNIAKALSDENITKAGETLDDVVSAMKRLAQATGVVVGAFAAWKVSAYSVAVGNYATSVWAAVTATDALAASTKLANAALLKSPILRVASIVSDMNTENNRIGDELKGKVKIKDLRQEAEVTARLTTEMTKLGALQRDIGKRTIEHPFKVTKADVENQKLIVRNLMDSVTTFNTKKTAKPIGGGAKPALMSGEDVADTLATSLKLSKEGLTVLQENAIVRADILLKKEAVLTQIQGLRSKAQTDAVKKEIALREGWVKTFDAGLTELDKKDSKYRESQAGKAEVAANKENRRQLSAMEKMQQLHQTEMANAQLEEAASLANFNLDQSRLTVIERLKLRQLDNEAEGLGNELIATNSITDATLRNFEQQQAIEKIYKNRTEYSTLLLKLEQGITEETERQSLVADKLSRAQFRGSLKELSRSAKSPETQSEFERIFGKDKLPRTEAYGLIEEAKTKYRKETFSITDPEQREKVREDLNKFVDGIKSKIVEIPDIEIKFKLFGGDELTRTFMTIADTMGTINDKTKEYDLLINEAKKSGKDSKKLEEAKAQSQIRGYGQIASAMSSMFAQGSREAEAFRTIEGGLAIVAGVRAILTQGSGDPYTAFARIAAMTALVASTLQSAGIAFGGAGSVSTSYDAFASQAVNTGTGSVFGDTKAQSESITNSLELLSDLAKPEFRLISQMNQSLISIDQKIGGLSANILRAGGFAVGEGYVGSSSMGGANQFMSSGVGGLLTGGASLGLLGAGAGAALGLGSWAALGSFGPIGLAVGAIDQLLLGGTLTKFISGAIGSIVNGIFGGDSESNLDDAGITFASQFIDAAITGLQGQSYQVIRTVTDGGWFSGDDTSYDSYFGTLDEYTRKQFQLVLGNLYDTVVMAGEGLDKATTDIKTNLSDAVVTIGKISLTGKTGEQVQESLTAIFGKIGDDLVREAYATGPEYKDIVTQPVQFIQTWFGKYLNPSYITWKNAEIEFNKTRASSLDSFQQIGEGLFQTMTRVATGMEEAEYYISRLGVAFNDVVFTDIVNKQGDVALEALRQSILGVDEAIYGVNNGVSLMVDSLSGSAGELYDVYTTLTSLRQILTSTGQEAKYLSSSMVRGAGGINELSEAMGTYLETFFTDQEQFIHTVSVLRIEFDKLGIALPANNVAFRNLVSGIDLSTESGQELYGRVVLLSDGFGEFSTQLTDLYQPVRDLSDAFSSLSGSLGDTITTLLNAQTGTISPTRNLVGQFWSARGEVDTLLNKKGDLTKAEQDKLQGLIGRVSSLSTSIQSSVIGANTAMTGSLVSELAGVQKVLDLQNTVLKTIILNGDGTATDIATEGTLTQLVGALSSAGLIIPSAILPSFDVGTPYLPSDMVAQVHRGEMIVDAQSSNVLRKYGISSNDYLSPVMNKIYGKLDEMAGYMNRLDRNIDSAMQGRALRTVV